MEPDSILIRVTEALTADDDILLASAFGSVPQGQASFESDIDVALWIGSPTRAPRILKSSLGE